MIDRIKEKIEEYEITQIISIDDEWKQEEKTVDSSINLIQFLKETNLWRSQFDDLFEETEEATIQDFLDGIHPHLNYSLNVEEITDNMQSKAETPIFLKHLEDFSKEAGIPLKTYTKISEIKDITEANSIIFVDKEIEGQGSDLIREIISKIKEENPNKLNFFIVLSHTSLSEFTNHQAKMDYLNNGVASLPKEQIFDTYKDIYLLHGINKGTYDLEEFLKRTNEKLNSAILGKNIQDVFDKKREIEFDCYANIYSRELEEYHTLFKDAMLEGEAPINTIKKLVKGIKKDKSRANNENSLSIYQRFSKEMLKRVEALESETNQNELREEKISLSIKDESISNTLLDKTINNYFLDVNKGDLFSFNENKYGIVISQECNSVIRNNDEGINRKNSAFKLLQLEKIKIYTKSDVDLLENKKNEYLKDKYTTNSIKGKIKAYEKKLIKDDEEFKGLHLRWNEVNETYKLLKKNYNNYIWPIYIDGTPYALYSAKKIIEIDCSILDLCSLSRLGEANIIIGDSYKDFKSHYSKKYFEDFLNDKLYFSVCDSKIENNSLFSDSLDKDQKKLSYLSIKNSINVNQNEDGKITGFNIKRVGSLQSQRALFLLQEYLSSLSKPGFETALSFI